MKLPGVHILDREQTLTREDVERLFFHVEDSLMPKMIWLSDDPEELDRLFEEMLGFPLYEQF